MAIIKVCGRSAAAASENAPAAADSSEIFDKLRQLESRISSIAASGAVTAGRPDPTERRVITASSPAADSEPAPNVNLDIKTVTPDQMTPCEKWEQVLEEFRRINPAVAGALDGSSAATAGNVLFIFTPNSFFMELFKGNKDNAVSLGRAITTVLGQRYRISARCTTSVEETKSRAQQVVQKALQHNIETAVDNKTDAPNNSQ